VRSEGEHLPELDGLRGLAAMIVIVSHFSIVTNVFGGLLGFGAGQLGVMLFFVLSGFLMGRLYLTTKPTARSVAVFYRRRVARVVPLYLLVVLASVIASETFGPGKFLYGIGVDALATHLVFWRGDFVLWTIPVEMQFYAIFPVLWFIFAWTGNRLSIWLCLALVVIPLIGYPAKPALFPHAGFFALGLAISFIGGQWKLDGAFVASLALVILLFPRIAASLPFGGVELTDMWHNPAYLVAVGALLFSALHSRVASRMLGSRPFRYLGTVSYSIYLLHLPILWGLNHFDLFARNPALFFPVFVAATLLAASLSYALIEAPSRRAINHFEGWRPRQGSPHAASSGQSVMPHLVQPAAHE